MAERYCVPTSLPWRMPCVGSWPSQKRRSTSASGSRAGFGTITTEITPAGPFYFAEEYHQQYLHKVPNGYCGLGGTGVACPVGVGVAARYSAAARPTEQVTPVPPSPQ